MKIPWFLHVWFVYFSLSSWCFVYVFNRETHLGKLQFKKKEKKGSGFLKKCFPSFRWTIAMGRNRIWVKSHTAEKDIGFDIA